MSEPGEEMLSIGEVCRFLGGNERPLDQSTVYRWVRQKKIPPPVRMGPLTLRWRKTELLKAIDTMAKGAR